MQACTHGTWKTVRQDWLKLLKVDRDSSFWKRPPKICMPSRAKMKMKRTSRTSSALMEAIELTKLLTRLPIDDQYLGKIQFLWKSEMRHNLKNLPDKAQNYLKNLEKEYKDYVYKY